MGWGRLLLPACGCCSCAAVWLYGRGCILYCAAVNPSAAPCVELHNALPPCAPRRPPVCTTSTDPCASCACAARLVVEGQSGRSPCYHPMSETLPLAGVLGLCLTDGSTALSLADLHARGYLTLPPHLTHLLAQPPPNPAAAPTPTGSHQDAESTDTPVVSVSDGVQANQTAEEQVSELQQQQQAPPPQQETLPAQAQQAPQAPPAAPPAKSAHDAEFELWMQQDERMGSKAALKAAAELGDTRGLLPTGDVVAAAQAAVQAQAGQRVLWLSDVGVGDLVEVAPLAAVAHDGGAEAGGGAGCDDSITVGLPRLSC